jgi:hypothetical protein
MLAVHHRPRGDRMRRREFIATLAVAWAQAAPANERRAGRIGVLMAGVESDPDGQARLAASGDGLLELGWVQGRNLQIDLRCAAVAQTAFRYMPLSGRTEHQTYCSEMRLGLLPPSCA